MQISSIEPCSMVNGDGCRMVVVFQGCSLNCTGCFSKKLQNFNAGKTISYKRLAEMVAREYKESKILEGITLSGGNPQEQPELLDFLEILRELLPKKANIWLWSGFTMDEINKKKALQDHLQYIDVVITGRFDQTKKIEHPYFGSSNQEAWRKKNNEWNLDENG